MLGFKFIIIFNNFGINENIIFKNSKKNLQTELTNFDFLNLETGRRFGIFNYN